MNKKKAYIAPAILSITVCPALNILAGSVTNTGNFDFRNIDSGETNGGEFKSKININDVWE